MIFISKYLISLFQEEIFLAPRLMVLIYFTTFPLPPYVKVRKSAKIWKRYNQAPHLTQDTNGKVTVTTSQLDITNESLEVSPFPAGDHKALTYRRA